MLNKILSVAKNELRLSKLKLEVYKDNKRAVNLYKASGFQVERAFKTVEGKKILLMIKSIYEKDK